MKPTREYLRNHKRVRAVRGKADTHRCVDCGEQAQEWSHIHGTNPTMVENYAARCCSCHQKYDDHWSEDARAKVADGVRRVWAENPERRQFSEQHKQRMREAWVRRKARMNGGDA